ncbi:Type II secretion system protein G precursor [Planctomycetes bacterium CA13]|uniref:Type II secretion system protein G n=1 Tax=Novipirellula herctigrandis TaxID=2527986 RepID=A0A5C5ZA81_9BACT|nr:Type II secretion system protein G precursor [Planctomycetes bacterium CA13]
MRKRNIGFTLVELLVVIAIIGVLVGLSLPAMQNLRELSRRNACQQNLVELSLGLSAYSLRHTHYPMGTIAESGPIRNEAAGYHHNWITGILPTLDAQAVYDAIDRDVSVYAPSNADVRSLAIPTLRCPSESGMRQNTTCYAGIHASIETPIDETNDGVLFLNIPVRDDDITDGLSYTAFLGEKLSRFEEDLGWISGTRSSLRNMGHRINAELVRVRGQESFNLEADISYVGGLASDHPGGAHLLMGGGDYKFMSESTDLEVLRQMGTRADGEVPLQWKTIEPPSESLPVTKPVEVTKPAEAEEDQSE